MANSSRTLHMGDRLVNLEWQVGVSTSSSECQALNSPYVVLLMKIKRADGSMLSRTTQMSVAEFQLFHSELKDMAAALTTS